MNRVKQSRYDVMDSQIIEGDSVVYYDCLSINLDTFPSKRVRKNVLVKQGDVLRPDLFFYSQMETNNLEDVVLWLNDIPSRRDLFAGQSVQLPFLRDINEYYIDERRIN